MPEHKDIDDTKVLIQTGDPSVAPEFIGHVYIQNEPENKCIRVAIGTSSPDDYEIFGFIPRPYSGNPDGFLTSRCDWDLTIDTVNNMLYYSNAKNSTTWQALDGVPSGGGGD